jgi:hypothetical protein
MTALRSSPISKNCSAVRATAPCCAIRWATSISRPATFQQAAVRLREAVERDARYSAAWKLLGKALSEGGQAPKPWPPMNRGSSSPKPKGDLQAAREMGVFARRLRRQLLPAKR